MAIPTFDSEDTFVIVSASLEGILIKPLFIIWVVSFCKVRERRQDPARRPFTWMKIAYPFILIDIFFYLAKSIINVAEIPINLDPTFGNVSSTLDDIYYRLSDLCVLFENLGNIFLFLCVVDLGLSFLYVWNRHRNSHNRIRGMAGCLCVILFTLAITHFTKIEAFRTEFYNPVNNAVYNVDNSPDYNPTANSFTVPYLVIQLSVAFDIMLWVASVAVATFAIHIKIISRQTTRLRNSTAIYLAIGILYLLRNTWELASDLIWVLPKNSMGAPTYTLILNPILDTWVTFVVLVLIFVIGSRKRDVDSLWTTDLPETAVFVGVAQQPQQFQQAYPVPQYGVPQGSGVQYYP